MTLPKLLCCVLVLGACLVDSAAGGAVSMQRDWELVRSLVHSDDRGMTHYVLIPVQKQRDAAYYRRVATQVCGSNSRAMVFFWTNRAHVPSSAWMPVSDMRVMTAEYERHPSYKKPALRLAAWLYSTPEAAKQAHAFYAP